MWEGLRTLDELGIAMRGRLKPELQTVLRAARRRVQTPAMNGGSGQSSASAIARNNSASRH